MKKPFYGNRAAGDREYGLAGAFPGRIICSTATVMLAALAVTAIGGCASSAEQPDRELARAETSIEQAEQSGGRQYGSTELDTARDKLAKAQAAVERDDMEVARYYAEEAAVDADLAAAIGRNRKAEQAASELNKSIETLQEEISRNQNSRGELQ